MVNKPVFRWPKPLCFMLLVAHGRYINLIKSIYSHLLNPAHLTLINSIRLTTFSLGHIFSTNARDTEGK